MSVHENDLLEAARGSLHALDDAGRRAVATPSTSVAFGQAQMDMARTEMFQDAMLAALRARFAEIKNVSK